MNSNELFIISIQRSGSNWLHRCLSEHSMIRINGELNVSMMLQTLDLVRAGDEISELKLKSTGIYKQAAQEYIRLLMRANTNASVDDEFTYLTDKSAYPGITSLIKKPEQKQYAQTLNEYFPVAKKILILRNARDVVVSFSEWKKQNIGSLLIATPRSLKFFIRHLNNWCTLHESWLKNIEKNNNWHIINYEDMKNNFSDTLKKTYEFLELEVNEKFISDVTEKWYGINNPVYQKENKERGYSFFRKGDIGEWQEKYAWWHKVIYNLLFKSRVEKIYLRIGRLNN
ncbi:hypothetical protein MNBD_GAMMA09-3278 [hydrothermal vent metagenome]|uniref:Sulfotransferase domain-containing protein n=1 Tax=hydrothermal vent metagenome TaxID=652676 RepID=A0A3B0YBL9_9ZZZZ